MLKGVGGATPTLGLPLVGAAGEEHKHPTTPAAPPTPHRASTA